MCGFAGEFLYRSGNAGLQLARSMAARVRHRGPDEEGSFLSADGRCAIGFHRLAVIDPTGSHQPMTSEDGNLTVAFNGEIYNFRALRQEISRRGGQLRTSGDTEVLLHLYRQYGQAMLDHLEGMFALAIYDSSAGRLMLARDRLGQKPLWYAPLDDRVAFASEAKALLVHPRVSRKVDAQALTSYFTIGYIPAPRSIWAALRKLPPAHFMIAAGSCQAPVRYWQPATADLPPTRQQQVELVRQEVTRAVESHMVSDVPLGVLLSGGVDSSIVTALMCRAAGRAGGVRSFTAGFEDAELDERPAARMVANHCATDHTELLVATDVVGTLDKLVAMYDEPFADSSAMATSLICRAAREHVKVALTGDGGDETFAGYDRYRALHLAETMTPWRYAATRLAAWALKPWARHDERSRARRFIRFADSLPYPFSSQYFMYRRLFGPEDLARLFDDRFASQVDLGAPAEWFCNLYEDREFPDEVARAQYHDLMTYLPDDLLVKTDIASMAVSLEARAPLLDHKLVALGIQLPVDTKVSGRKGKLILQEAFADLLPPATFSRPKRGFAVPLGRWLREDLLDMLRGTLLDGTVGRQGILRPESVAGLINDHVTGCGDHRHRLWAVLVFQRWLLANGGMFGAELVCT